MLKIAVFTTSRAEFGILSSLLREIRKEDEIDYYLFVGGSHLVIELGKTINEIKEEFEITDTFDFFLNEDSSYSLSKSLGIEQIELASIFRNYDFDAICVLGDRFELLPIVNTAIIFKKPIIHIHGGETTQGAIDEQVRHMITKAAHVHFVSCDEYKENIRKMGEPESRVFNVGALSVDNIVNNKVIIKSKLFNELKLDKSKNNILLTYHPVTLEYKLEPLTQIKNVFKALDKFNFQVVITAPNNEIDRNIIMGYIENIVNSKRDYHFVESLGINRYLSLIPHCEFVIGNSSSGINEVPFFRIPTVNIGDRQKGRIRHKSVIDVDYSINSIVKGIKNALEPNFRKRLKKMKYKFGDGHAAERILKILKDIKINEQFMRKESEFSAYE